MIASRMRSRGQALVEHLALASVIVAALCVPYGDEGSVVMRLARALSELWSAYRELVMQA